jgi:hypothetical protein
MESASKFLVKLCEYLCVLSGYGFVFNHKGTQRMHKGSQREDFIWLNQRANTKNLKKSQQNLDV